MRLNLGRPYTLQLKDTIWHKILSPRFGKMGMKKLNRLQFMDWLAEFQFSKGVNHDEEYSHEYLNNVVGLLASMMADAVANDVIARNPLVKIKIGGKDRDIPHMELEQFQALLKVAITELSNRDRLMLYLAAHSLRIGEVRGIRIKDFNGTQLTIQSTRVGSTRSGIKKGTKNKTSTRVIELMPYVMPLIPRVVTEARAIYFKHGEKDINDKEVFITSKATPLQYSYINKKFHAVGDKVGVALSPHVLRHAFATFAFDMNANPRDIANYLGHSKVDMSMYYNLGTDKGKRELAKRFYDANIAK